MESTIQSYGLFMFTQLHQYSAYGGIFRVSFQLKGFHMKTKEFGRYFCQYLKNNMADIRHIPLDNVTYVLFDLNSSIIQQSHNICTRKSRGV